jgi:indolepyruvate ferredoxin oxidoreductase alpha subunit
VDYGEIAKAAGIENVFVINPVKEYDKLKTVLQDALEKEELTLIVAKSPCVLAIKSIVAWDKANKQNSGILL